MLSEFETESAVAAPSAWRRVFENWPPAIPREGLVVTNFDETIPFNDFLVSGGILLVQRDKPDIVGARKVMLSYEAISAVKIPSPQDLSLYRVMGFQPPA